MNARYQAISFASFLRASGSPFVSGNLPKQSVHPTGTRSQTLLVCRNPPLAKRVRTLVLGPSLSREAFNHMEALTYFHLKLRIRNEEPRGYFQQGIFCGECPVSWGPWACRVDYSFRVTNLTCFSPLIDCSCVSSDALFHKYLRPSGAPIGGVHASEH